MAVRGENGRSSLWERLSSHSYPRCGLSGGCAASCECTGHERRRLSVQRVRRTQLQEITKLLDGKPGVANDTAERKGVDRVVARDRQDARSV